MLFTKLKDKSIKLSLIGLILLILLNGCSKIESTSEMLDLTRDAISDAITSDISSTTNLNKGFISFYLAPQIGRREANRTNSILIINGEEVVLTIDVPSIIAAKYYYNDVHEDFRTVDSFPNCILNENRSFLSGSGLVREFRCQIYQITEKDYGVLLQTSNIIMIAEADMAKIPELTKEMIRTLRTIRVDEEKVVSAYSKKELISYKKETLDIFQTIYPENGSLQEMVQSSISDE